ncbi:MAG TPA: hypothetical protein VF739_08005 [Ktedonobacterales bacterium]
MNPPERPQRSRPRDDRARTVPLTSPLKSMPVYRPAPYLALIAILLPGGLAGLIAALALNNNQPIPIWAPLLLLLLIPLLTVAWLLMRSVRLSPTGIAVGRPFQRWREAMWHQIIRAERHGMSVRIYTLWDGVSHGDYIAFTPRLLLDGDQLLKVVLSHLRPQILDGALRMEALDQLPIPEGEMTGSLRARPRNRWPFGALLLALLGAVGGMMALWFAPEPLAVILGTLGALAVLIGLAGVIWLRQEVIVTPEGLTIIRPWRRAPDEVLWGQVMVVDHSPHWALLKFRIGRSVRCIGPGLLRAPERDRMFAFINRYCLQHGVVNYPHAWPF